ncbi:hypothetical protein BJ508DRAFT_89295 [Ascobolus immersus RN42]|uniref:Uncharacterized protein n=1 Tax=Ascobolus immersus RN42 TaxID=1160509 RepID=A0A3N4IAL9_ASCIM|nr:hypothetical protein BJ508DRAFT_89295 [Ascobolus immersus RN42]
MILHKLANLSPPPVKHPEDLHDNRANQRNTPVIPTSPRLNPAQAQAHPQNTTNAMKKKKKNAVEERKKKRAQPPLRLCSRP